MHELFSNHVSQYFLIFLVNYIINFNSIIYYDDENFYRFVFEFMS